MESLFSQSTQQIAASKCIVIANQINKVPECNKASPNHTSNKGLCSCSYVPHKPHLQCCAYLPWTRRLLERTPNVEEVVCAPAESTFHCACA